MNRIKSGTAWLAALAAALSVAGLFWVMVAPRLTLPIWQASVLPAALAGLILGHLAYRWALTGSSARLLLALAAGVGLCTGLLGLWVGFSADLHRHLDAARAARPELAPNDPRLAELLRGLAESAQTEQANPVPVPPAAPGEIREPAPATAAPSLPSLDRVRVDLFLGHLRRRPVETLASLAVALVIAMHAAWLSSRPTLRPPADPA